MRTIFRNFSGFLFLQIFAVLSVSGQNNLGVKLLGLTADYSTNKQIDLLVNKLDDAGKYLMEPGAVLAYEHFSPFNDAFSLKFMQGIFFDAAGQIAGFSHLGFRLLVFQNWKHSITVGFGPTLQFRKDRSGLKDYKQEEEYDQKGSWEYRMAWLSGEFEYSYYISKKLDFTFSIFPIHRKAYVPSVGIKYWFDRSSSSDCGCSGSGKRYKYRKRRRR